MQELASSRGYSVEELAGRVREVEPDVTLEANSDLITGTKDADTLLGLSGDDTVYGSTGKGFLVGPAGDNFRDDVRCWPGEDTGYAKKFDNSRINIPRSRENVETINEDPPEANPTH